MTTKIFVVTPSGEAETYYVDFVRLDGGCLILEEITEESETQIVALFNKNAWKNVVAQNHV